MTIISVDVTLEKNDRYYTDYTFNFIETPLVECFNKAIQWTLQATGNEVAVSDAFTFVNNNATAFAGYACDNDVAGEHGLVLVGKVCYKLLSKLNMEGRK